MATGIRFKSSAIAPVGTGALEIQVVVGDEYWTFVWGLDRAVVIRDPGPVRIAINEEINSRRLWGCTQDRGDSIKDGLRRGVIQCRIWTDCDLYRRRQFRSATSSFSAIPGEVSEPGGIRLNFG